MFKKKKNKDDKKVIEEEKRDDNPNKPSSHSGASESETKEIEELISEIDVPDKNQEPEKNTTQVVASIPQNSVPISNHLEAQKTTSLQSTIFASKPEQVSPQIEILSTKSENKEDPLNKRLTEAYEKLESMANVLDSLQTNFSTLTSFLHDSNELRKSIPGEVKGEITGHLEKAPKPFQQNLGFFPDSSKSKFSNDQNNQKNFSKPQEFSNSETDLNSGKSSYNMMSFIMSKMLDQNKEENFPDKKDKEKYLYFLIEKSMEIVKDQEFISKLLLQNKSGRGGPPSDSDKTLLISLLMK